MSPSRREGRPGDNQANQIGRRFEWERAIRALPIRPPARKLVALMIATYADGDDGRNAHPGVDRLAVECGISERSVMRHLVALRDVGLIVRTYSGSNAGRRKLADEYALEVPADILERLRPGNEQVTRVSRVGTPDQVTRVSGSGDTGGRSGDTRVPDQVTPVSPHQDRTKDEYQPSPLPTHPSASVTGSRARAADETELCDVHGSAKRTTDGDCVPCTGELARRSMDEAEAS